MGAASYHDPVYTGGGRAEPHLNPEMGGPRGAYRQDSHSLLTPVGSADYVFVHVYCLLKK